MNKGMLKKAASLILAVCMVLSALPASAQERTVYIETVGDLKKLAENCTLDSWSRGLTVILKNNINVSGSGFKQIPTFGGTFEGGGYTISGLSINANEPVQGFFRYIQEGATVRGLTVKGNIRQEEGEDTFGGIAGVNMGNILNCSFYGNINGESIVGGIAGINETTGRIGNCISEGIISSEKYTGGIAGENFGTIIRCVNRSQVNTSSTESSVGLEDISITSLDETVSEETNPLRGHMDTGGIAGYSGGLIQSCQNYGLIGYQHMGYNIGGIAGRQGGYISGCTNHSQVLGRKDVGGITGQAEPHIILRYTSDSLQQLDSALDDMQALVNGMLDDIDDTTSNVSNRIDAISGYAADARDSSKELLDDTSDYFDDIKDFANDNIDEINEFSVRIADIFDRLVPVLEDLEDVSDSMSDAINMLRDALDGFEDLDDGKAAESLNNSMEHLSNASKNVKNALGKLREAAEKLLGAAVSGDNEEMNSALNELREAASSLETALNGQNEAILELKEALENTVLPIESDKKEQIKAAVGKLADNTAAMAMAAGQISSALSKIVINSDLNWDDVKDAFSSLSGITEDIAGAAEESAKAVKNLFEALTELGGIGGSLGDIFKDMGDSLEGMTDSADGLTHALRKTKNILKDLADKDPIEFKPLDSDYHLDTQELHASLSGISNELSALNTDIKSSSDMMTNDLRAINNQFNLIIDIMIDAITNDDEKDLSDLTLDTSDTDIHKTTEGKLDGCVNYGKVEADLNVGGIAGAMGIEYDLDPEDDISSIGKRSLNFRYETKDVVLGCVNYGTVVSKKNCVGGIVGRMDLGTAAECEGYGCVSSSSGDYIGGIAGLSDSTVKDSYVKCILSGGSYIGGIAGKGNTIENCGAIIDIEESVGRIGAIAGDDEERENVRGNIFINTGWAGIGGISYEGKAEPVSDERMRSAEGVPDDFLEFSLKFMANGSLIKTVPFTFGEDLSSLEFPEIPKKDGCYGSWPDTDLSRMTFSRVIEAEYKPWVTVLTSAETGENTSKPLALAEGTFTGDDRITAQYSEAEKLPGGALGESSVISVRIDSGSIGEDSRINIRLLKPQNSGDVNVWQFENGKWHRISAEENGSYVMLELEGEEGLFCIAPSSDTLRQYAAVGIVSLLAAVFIVTKGKKVLKRVEKKKENK